MQRVVVNCSTVAAVCVHSSRVSEVAQYSTWTETCSFVSIFPAVHFQEELKVFGAPFFCLTVISWHRPDGRCGLAN